MPERDDTNDGLSPLGGEGALPRVPLPGLAASGERFLQWCAPLLDAAEFAETEAAVAALLRSDGPGPRLQAALEAYDAEPGVHSWLDTYWQYRYLGVRERSAGNVNYFLLLEDDPAPAGDEPQVSRAAGLVAAAVNHKLALDARRAAQSTRDGESLSTIQHHHLFGTTRIPGFAEDTLRAPAPDTRHIAVLFRGHIFRLDVLGPDGTAHSLDDLVAGLREIHERGATPATPDTAVGNLTSRHRSQWAASRQGLLGHDPRNEAALDTVERALLCLCLDDDAGTDTATACERLLHGESANRWFDKSVSLIVFADGRVGLNVDLGAVDETVAAEFTDALLDMPAAAHARQAGAVSRGLPVVEPVEFVLDEALRANVRVAGEEFAEHRSGIATCTVSFDDFGTDTTAQLGVPPDAFVQVAYQLAQHRATGSAGTTSEPVDTRRFHHGRTETMRATTPESTRFVTTMDDPEADVARRAELLRAALAAHERRARECAAGHAPEQHLAELQRIAQRRGRELGIPMPEVFSSPGWRRLRADHLTARAVSSEHIRFFGFGPPCGQANQDVPGIGVGHVLLPRRFSVHLSAPAQLAELMHAFRDELRAAVAELRELAATAR